MKIKLDSKMSTKAGESLGRLAQALYEASGRRVVAARIKAYIEAEA